MKTLDLNWWRIVLAFVIPTLLGVGVAMVLWRRRDTMMGSVVAGGLIFALILLFFAGEYIEVTRFQIACQLAGIPCKLRLGDFNRFVIYGFIAFIDVAIVFTIGLRIEDRRRRQPFRASSLTPFSIKSVDR